ncbi:hypothetical protein LMG18090_03708 [Ralstonia mannitolilytica]|nr:hypothetical protein LMG18090_03708 [Ralstonia mannitolilytica]
MVCRSKRLVQRVVALVLRNRVVVVLLVLAQRERLRRAGLARRHILRADERLGRRARLVHAHHGALDHVDVGLLERNAVALGRHRQRARLGQRILDRLHQVGLHHHAVVGQRRHRVRQLQDREAVVALADAQRDRFTVVPLLLLGALVRFALPFGGRQDAGALAFDVDPGDLPEAQRLHEIVDRVDAHVVGELVVVRIARHHDGAEHVDPAVAARRIVAERVVAERERARVGHAPLWRALAELQRGQCHEGLVGGAWRIGAAQRAVQQRLVGRVVELVPGCRVDALDEEVRVERRLRDEGQDVARLRLDRHQRAAAVAEELLRQPLQVDVERQDQVVARRCLRGRQRADRPPARAHLHFFVAGQAVQLRLVALLDADLADVFGAAVVVRVLARVVRHAGLAVGIAHVVDALQVALGDPADVADHVRGGLAQRVLAEQPRVHVHARKAEALRRETRDLLVGELAADRQAFKAAGVFHQPLEAAAVARLDVDHLRELVDRVVQRVLQLGRRDLERVGGIVARQHHAVAVHDDAAVGLDGRDGDAVVFGLGRVLLVLDLLQPEEAREQQPEADQHEQRGRRQPQAEARQLLFDVADFGHA